MEPEEDEPMRVCRLCGKCRDMNIDVFGEEGTRRFLGFKIHSKINIQMKPDDGLPQIVCVTCLGSLEFICDFIDLCHKTQENFETNVQETSNAEPSEDKRESDTESNKENVLPSENGKRKEKASVEQIKSQKTVDCGEKIVSQKTVDCSEKIVSQRAEVLNNPAEKTNSYSSLNNANETVIDKHNANAKENSKQQFITTSCNKSSNQSIKEEISETSTKSAHAQISKESNLNRVIREVVKKKTRPSKSEKKNKQTRSFSANLTKNKKIDGKQSKTIDKYFVMEQTPPKEKSTNVENENPNYIMDDTVTSTLSTNINTNENIVAPVENTNINENVEEGNVIFEGTVINSTGDTSVIMPLKTESFNNDIRLDNVVMADGSEIVKAQEIVWVSSNPQSYEPEKPKTTTLKKSQNTSPPPGDEAELSMEAEGTILEQASTQDVQVISSEDQLIVLEVQLPAKENVVPPKNNTSIKRNRSISTTSSERRSSEGKFAKISELMTDEQKKEIETHYTIDMSRVDEPKVKEHLKVVLSEGKYECKICQTTYSRLDKCIVHIWGHLDMKPYLCKACTFSTLTVSNIRCHIRKRHLKIKPFQCHICNKCYNSSTLLEEHLNIHTGARPFNCEFCKFASASKQVLAHHVLIHKSEKDITCDVCGKAFYSKGRMRAHKFIHDKEKAFKCTLCSTYVLHKEALEKHYENVHNRDYVCKVCNKVYKSRKALHNHESVHSEAKYSCPLCPNKYKSTHILKEHLLKHKGIRQYKCNSCDKSFAQQSHLAAHMAVHSDITYNCPGCQKGFNRHDNMKVHAKRCNLFLANPELQNLLTKRKISFSKNDTAKVGSQKGKENDNDVGMNKKLKKTKTRSKKAAVENETVKQNSESNNNDLVENELSVKDF